MHVVFQGGGAKLVPLIAAADAIYEKKKELNIEGCAGTSAGAIAAAMVAYDIPPSLFKAHLISLADKYFPKIIKKLTLSRAIPKILTGHPLYNSEEYRNFLQDLFEVNGTKYVWLSQAICDLHIHSCDIRNGCPKIYHNKDEHQNLTDALFDSTALPFIFSTYRKGSQNIDGGALNNFPAADLVGQFGSENVIGFSFPTNYAYKYNRGLLSYAGAIAGTVVDHPVKTMISELPPDHVCPIETQIGTLDFDEAIKHLKDATIYDAYKNQALDFLDKLPKRPPTGMKSKSARPARQTSVCTEASDLSERLEATFRSIHEFSTAANLQADYEVHKKTFIYTCDTLARQCRDVDQPHDTIRSVESISLLSGRVVVFRQSLLTEDEHYDLGDVSFRIRSTENPERIVGASPIVMPPDFGNKIPEAASVALLLHEPLTNSDNTTWEIEYTCRAAEPLSYIGTPGDEDTWLFNNCDGKAVKCVEAVFFVPKKFSDIILTDMYAKHRPDACPWVQGRAMTEEELQRVDLPPGNYRAIGWTASNVPPGGAMGFVAYRTSS